MRRFSISLGWLAAGCLLVFAGCGDSKSDEAKTKSKPPVKTNDEEKTKTSEGPPPPKAEIAKVELSAEEQAACIVKQNDPFPDAKLKNLAGAEQTLAQLRGQQATVVLLWGPTRTSKGALKTIAAKASQERPGIGYVSIFMGEGSDAKQTVDGLPAPVPTLIDADLSLAKRVIKLPEGRQVGDFLPRVYLLDPAGKILWMSLALQTADERELENAIQFVLKQP